MEIVFEKCTVTGESVEGIARFTVQMSDAAKIAQGGRYDTGSLSNRIIAAIASEVANAYLDVHKMDLIKSLNLKEITDAIQLKVVEGFSLNRQ
ncbi:MAG TPA: hypothetical protein ENH62_03535 [Marinobacter sp.]|uniref:Uncharacterized protein n=1 Tax=marine sediment metagenome TaxID=412755 RepID=A0A0F9QVZ6_9ZZZZ|nr:hypothetical protein [Marinobacter sp.]